MVEIVNLDKVGVAGAVGLAAAAINAGYLVILPTDTLYGLTAAVFKPEDVQKMRDGHEAPPWREPAGKLYALKGRPGRQPSIILAPDWEYARMLTEQDLDRIEEFCRRVPNPVSVVVDGKRDWRPPLANARGGVALRVPKGGLIKIILKFCKFAFSVSANYARGEEPYLLDQVPAAILKRATLALDAGYSPFQRASFIVDFTVDPPRPLRGGKELEEALLQFWE
ncbi:MAG: Sua5/YciO/YrdC/YwlC family protein [bacterium]